MATAAPSKHRPHSVPPTTPKKPTRRSIGELEENLEIDDRKLEPGKWEDDWIAHCNAVEADIWSAQDLIPQAAREECLAYLYRLEPAVFNQGNEGSNIGKYQIPCTLDMIRKDHGGGKYKMWLKRGPRTLLSKVFAIGDCEPIYKEGQMRRDGKPIGEASTKGESTVEIIREVAKLTKGEGDSKTGMEATVGMMSAGFKSVMDAQAAVASSATGSKIGDTMLATLLERALTPVDPLASLAKAAEVLKSLTPAPPVTPPVPSAPVASVNDQFAMVKELTGVESIAELFKRNRGPAETPWYAGPLVGLAQNIPSILNFIAGMAEKNFQRQVYLASLKTGEVPGAIPATVAAPVASVASPAPQPITPAPPQTQDQIIESGAMDIQKYFVHGFDGGSCAVHLMMDLPQFVDMLRPALSDRSQIDTLIAQIPPLAECARQQPGDWNEFVQEFVDTIKNADEVEDKPPGEVIPMNTPTTTAS